MTDTDSSTALASTENGARAVRSSPTKSATVQKLLSRNKGATLGEIMAVTHWQPHSTRSFLTGLRKKGVELLKEARAGGETCWRIDR
jgi:hypothetical protein